MNRLPYLATFSKVATGAMHAFNVRTLEQPEEHRADFAEWCFKTQFAKMVNVGLGALT